MKVLAFDLVWTGRTGWALFDTYGGVFLAWGDFTPTKVQAGEPSITTLAKAKNLQAHLDYPINTYAPDWIVYEQPDFYNVKSPIRESEVASALSMAALVLLLLADEYAIPTREMGVGYVRHKFEAQSKRAVAVNLSYEFGNFEYNKHDEGYLRVLPAGEKLPHDVTDAMAVAYVAGRDLDLETRIERQ